MSDWLTLIFVILGLVFFAAGTLGVIRFPDLHSRLHALTKADNLGLACMVIGAAWQAPSLAAVVKLLVIWVLVLIAGATSAQIIARTALNPLGKQLAEGERE